MRPDIDFGLSFQITNKEWKGASAQILDVIWTHTRAVVECLALSVRLHCIRFEHDRLVEWSVWLLHRIPVRCHHECVSRGRETRMNEPAIETEMIKRGTDSSDGWWRWWWVRIRMIEIFFFFFSFSFFASVFTCVVIIGSSCRRWFIFSGWRWNSDGLDRWWFSDIRQFLVRVRDLFEDSRIELIEVDRIGTENRLKFSKPPWQISSNESLTRTSSVVNSFSWSVSSSVCFCSSSIETLVEWRQSKRSGRKRSTRTDHRDWYRDQRTCLAFVDHVPMLRVSLVVLFKSFVKSCLRKERETITVQ